MYSTISKCRICGNSELDSLLDLGNQALTGVFPATRDTFVASGPLELVKCRENGPESCGLVQLRDSFQASEMYGQNYGYRSGLNQSMVEHLRNKARRIKGLVSLSAGDLVLDIGSNDSTLLRAMDEPGLRLVGMDPSGSRFLQFYPENVQLIPDFFSSARFRQEFGKRRAKVVTSIAMFYDLDAPTEFVRQVYEILDDDGVWVFELSYLPAMLKNVSYDTICHEHLEYYALRQIRWMLKRVGFRIVDIEVNDINGGSFSVTVAKEGSSQKANEVAINSAIQAEENLRLGESAIYTEFRDSVFRHRDDLRDFLHAAKASGEKLLGYGASTKGNVILQFCGITENDIACIAEVNPDKFGCFTPGTHIPIVSDADARAMRPDAFLVLPWHFRDHILAREGRFLSDGGKLIFPLPRIDVVQ